MFQNGRKIQKRLSTLRFTDNIILVIESEVELVKVLIDKEREELEQTKVKEKL